MKNYLVLLALLIVSAVAPVSATVCDAIAIDCELEVSVTAPPGGSCRAFNRGYYAAAVAYDSAGNIVESYTVTCPIGPC